MLARLITEELLLDIAGERSFGRGAAYFEAGAVVDLVDTGKAIKARVSGSEEYAVRLWAEAERLGYDCSCPVGDEGEFCKHAVAAGLAWIAQRGDGANSRPGGDKDLGAIRDWLGAAPRETLMELLMEQAEDDAGFRHRLLARAARAEAGRNMDLKGLKETVTKALAVHRFVDYYGMRRLLERAYPVLDLVAGLRQDGHAATAWELAHHALKRGLAAYEKSDDSGGTFGELLRQIADEHLEACRAARPDPAILGKQLFDFMLCDQWGLVAFEDYAPLLKDAGLKTFRAAAEKEWRKVPARGAGEDRGGASRGYFQIAQIMETLARRAGDTDALVAIKSRDLSYPYHFLQIAEILVEADRADEALDWAERGQAAFRQHDGRLVDFLVETYRERARHDDAIRLSWETFVEQPSLAGYQRLKGASDATRAWPAWREKTLAWIRAQYPAAPKKSGDRRAWAPGGRSLLVEILLWEGDSDAALKEAREGSCTRDLWFRIAEAREAGHPGDAAEIYRAHLEAMVERRDNRAYDEAAQLLGKIRELMDHAGQGTTFAAYMAEVRARHKAKRNFMQRISGIATVASNSR